VCLLPKPNALVAVSKDTPAVKRCSNRIPQFLINWGCRLTQVVLYNACKTAIVGLVVIVVVVVAIIS